MFCVIRRGDVWSGGSAPAPSGGLQGAWGGGRFPPAVMKPVRFCLGVLLAVLLTVRSIGDEAAGPAPLVADADVPSAGWMIKEARANEALQAGFPATAAIIYREVLSRPALPADVRSRIQLSLVTALFDAGAMKEAEALLQSYDGPRTSAFHLRAGLVAANLRRIAAAKTELAAVRAEELAKPDVGWWHYLQALVAEADDNADVRRREFDEAVRAAVSETQRARFVLGQEMALLRADQASDQQLASLRTAMERFAGQPTGHDYVRYYAAALSVAGRKAEALAVLQRALAALGSSEREAANQFRLLLGLIAGEKSVEGRRAFSDLVRNGIRPETQRTALYLLARGASTPGAREQLRQEVTELIAASQQNPIIEDLYLIRAEARLADQQYADAEEDARVILEQYPASPLKSAALGVRLAVAWELKRYRAAADVIAQLRGLLPAGREHSELGVLLAEAYFRAEDYQNAADAYEAALHESPAVVPPGTLIYQQVLAAIRAGQLDAAAALLDEPGKNPVLDPVNRWQAEWNLVREMQVRGRTRDAYDRVGRLLAGGAEGVPVALRIRLQWLQAKLSYDNGQTSETLNLADALLGQLPAAQEIGAETLASVAANTMLLKAEALLAMDRDADGVAVMEKLRADHRGTSAAIYSYIVQAARLTRRGELARAQEILTRLADTHKASDLAPVALYEAALNAEQQGLDRNLEEANNLLERINRDYPDDPLRFYALLKQGDLLRKLNSFGPARQAYEFAVNHFPQHPDVLLAQMALAETLFAMGANSVTNRESAAALFERLRDLPSAPVDLRAEAGVKWGYALAKRQTLSRADGKADPEEVSRAIAVFWSVVDTFLLDPEKAAQLGTSGRWWVSRALLELGELHEERGNIAEAQRAYRLIIDQKLNGTELARAKLDRYRLPPEEAKS